MLPLRYCDSRVTLNWDLLLVNLTTVAFVFISKYFSTFIIMSNISVNDTPWPFISLCTNVGNQGNDITVNTSMIQCRLLYPHEINTSPVVETSTPPPTHGSVHFNHLGSSVFNPYSRCYRLRSSTQ